MKKIGDKISFTGGAEPTPSVEVIQYREIGSLNDRRHTFRITQLGASVVISPGTLEAILLWYKE